MHFHKGTFYELSKLFMQLQLGQIRELGLQPGEAPYTEHLRRQRLEASRPDWTATKSLSLYGNFVNFIVALVLA